MRKLKLNPVVLIVFICALAMLVGNTYARYAKTETVNGTLTVSANLGEISMSKETIQAKIIPGVDIPVKHTVVITDKSSIPAYVYLVIEITNGSNLDFKLSNSSPWMEISKTTANAKTTMVYVYANNGTPVEVTSEVTSEVNISVEGTLDVSQNYTANGNVTMTFAAAMYQKMTDEGASVKDAKDVYTTINNQ